MTNSKIEELEKLHEHLKQAKDDLMQSWLDSKPLIDELEKSQAELARVKARVIKANALITELQAQLGTTEMCIESTKGENSKLKWTIVNKNEDLERMQDEVEKMKTEIYDQWRKLSKLKQVLRLKRQSLLTLQLTHQAIKMDTKAFEKSTSHALSYTSNEPEVVDKIMVTLSRDEYYTLKRKASEKHLLVEGRISASMEKKLVAEKGREAAFRRLKQLYSERGSSRRRTREKGSPTEGIGDLSEEQYASVEEVHPTNQELKSKNPNFPVKKKKKSLFYLLSSCFARKSSKRVD